MATIARIDVFPLRLPITKGFTFASGTAGAVGSGAPHVLVKITDSDGAIGWGECRPVPQWSYETLETVTTTLRNYLAPALIGLDVTDRHGLHRRMFTAIGRGPSTGQPIAKAAIDHALHDLVARRAGVTLREYLGGSKSRNTFQLSYTLTGHTRADIESDMRPAQENGFVHFNFKAAVDPKTDIEVAETVRRVGGPECFVWADANQGFNLHNARRVAEDLRKAGADLLEQPLPADQFQLMRQLRGATTIPLAIDEASVSPADFFLYAAERLVDYLVIKLTRSGGIWPTLQQISTAQAAGLGLVVSGLTDGFLTKLSAINVASVYGVDKPIAMNGSQFMDESAIFPQKGEFEKGGTVHLPDAPGVGIEPDEKAMKRFLAD